MSKEQILAVTSAFIICLKKEQASAVTSSAESVAPASVAPGKKKRGLSARAANMQEGR